MISSSTITFQDNLIETIKVGDSVTFPTRESGMLVGTVRYKDDKTNVIAGIINDDIRANFNLYFQEEQYSGSILDLVTEYGYEITQERGETRIVTKDIQALICFEYPTGVVEQDGPFDDEDPDDETATSTRFMLPFARTTVVPNHNSRPGSQNVLYLDFDGEYVVHPDWNGGAPIDALPADYPLDGDPSSFSDDEIARIKRVWESVSEDYALFDVNVTTERAKYDAAASTNRQQAIITSTLWHPDAPSGDVAGIAQIGSFAESGDTPAWSFYFLNSIYAANVVSHELGHTLGLFHDGLNSESYHPGVGYWGPIMGAPDNKDGAHAASPGALNTWSKGDYTGATNTFQDDISIVEQILSFRPDKYGNSTTSAKRAKNNQVGIIGANNDKDVFYIDLAAGQTIQMDVNVFTHVYPNLDSKLVLRGPTGATLATNNPEPSTTGGVPKINAAITHTVSSAGRYFIEVSGVGYSDAVYSYSSYGSVGNYTLTITQPIVPNVPIVPVHYLLLLE